MSPMKVGGYEELERALVRSRKLLAADRIRYEDQKYIEDHILAAQARIIEMQEYLGNGKEVSNAP
jgi:hypothetical protein